ncbi:MAG TPA: sulfurtransferase-like selenium metabolism protein YedF [Bacillota bacterium]|nr:sulfurtransferase-like selenium metabolism protein YedF [Bacillota bacterium]HOR86644.1 sulfurtransferase-like selenium metabolism protein YedF [Bacillota bacterium]HPL53356.1 sulfurtransferase-like selenium metabolism protein YedF [Bacillota bacterium]HPL53357.1 sulfurtransferase-like selenium metabolism protein YedF [Bacillota bacterium]
MIKVDVRGLACPQPVVLVKKALEEATEGEVIAIADNATARENILRLAESLNYKYEVSDENGCNYIKIEKASGAVKSEKKESGITIVITSDKLGQGSEELGKVLMKSYIYALTETIPLPKALLFLNGGVKLTIEGSGVLESLSKLENSGVEVISCGTCLDFYQSKEKLKVGIVGNMYSIIEKMNSADKVINIG